VATLPNKHFAGWAHYFIGILIKDCKPHLTSKDAVEAMMRFGAAAGKSNWKMLK
jgi:hypothetical protein